ncbi:MAG: histidine kinase dimerization/phosphoacceptor domain -containing protein [Balneolales bacterium]
MLTKKEIYDVFLASPVASLIVLPDSPRFTIVEANDAYLTDTKSKLHDLAGKGLFEAFPQNPFEPEGTRTDKLISSFEQVLTTKKPHKLNTHQYDIPIRGTDRFETRYWNLNNIPVLNDTGSVRLIMHTVTDITKVVLLEQNEKESEKVKKKGRAQYRSLFVQNPLAVYSFDMNGKLLSANKSAAKMAECPVKDLLNRPFAPLIAPGSLKKVLYRSRKAILGEPQNFDAEIITTKGNRYLTNMTHLPMVVNGRIVGVYGILMNITERLIYERQLKTSLKEKEVLLTEVHHRVKNNLAIITSLLAMQADSVKDKQLQELLKISENRIRAMGMIHELLYNQEDFSKIAFGIYINKLLAYLSPGPEVSGPFVKTTVHAEDIFLDINTAIPCALILNELLTNAYKHAFKNRATGDVEIHISQSNHRYTLIVRDDGTGMFVQLNKKDITTLGLSLVHGLTRQIGGTIDIDSNQAGTTFTISFNGEPRVFA